ncbi:6812_t:CDS:2 [Funneliformis geosporum]|uniref:6812_t:CDS:1 n=1 Tax=Funneliformis geosporum TaxID=1117311 RepID=A0A9W4SCX6_9GLOM|nr:6812_t:CDS:2 [Funneliformis geosporum]
MTNPEQIKQKLGETTQQLENYLEPWQRGALILALLYALFIAIYLLTKKETPEPRELTDSERKKIENLAEERILKRADPESEKDKQQQQILLILLIIGIGYYFFVYLNNKREVAKAEINKLFRTNPTITVTDLDANKSVKEEAKPKKARKEAIKGMEEFAENKEKVKANPIRGELDIKNNELDNNALFYGAPRTGKSVMAEKLAYEADKYPLVVIQGSTLTPKKTDADIGATLLLKFIFTISDITHKLVDDFGFEREADGEVRYILFIDEADQICTTQSLPPKDASSQLTFLKECMGSDDKEEESKNL